MRYLIDEAGALDTHAVVVKAPVATKPRSVPEAAAAHIDRDNRRDAAMRLMPCPSAR